MKEENNMIELGKIQKLMIIKETPQGIYLNERDNRDEDNILLPTKEVPEEVTIGDEIEVFVYKDSEDRIIATTKRPKLMMGQLSMLKAVDETKFGAFLDWGLPKDLFLPFKEQIKNIETGKMYLVSLYVDKSNRLCATMKVSKLLDSKSPYEQNEKVEGTIYNINKEIGAFVAVDDKYHGLIPVREFFGDYSIGDKIEATVTNVKEDGKLDLSIREKAYKEIDRDAQKIIDSIVANDGILNLNDNSSPDKIKKELQMSKRAFKRAVGRLLKSGSIEFSDNGIRLKR